MQDELVERCARALCDDGGFDPDEIMPNDGPRWRYYAPSARAIIPIVQADQRKRFNDLVAKNAALEVAYEELLAQHRAAIRNQEPHNG